MNFGQMIFKFEYIVSHLIDKSSTGLPIICFSITNNQLHITTKKVASRYFEYLNDTTTYIEFYVKNITLNQNLNIENRLKFYDYGFELFSENSTLSVDEFFNKLCINSISDIFSKKFLDNWEVILITRNPIIRLLSGFTEIVDSIIGNSVTEENQNILKRNLSEESLKNFSGIRNLDSESLSSILNEYSKKISNILLEDEHTSAWNTFLHYLILKCEGIPNIIDIDDSLDMANYPNISSEISNKPVYQIWLEGNNRIHILNLIKSLEYLIVNEYSNYLRLKSIKNPLFKKNQYLLG